MSRLGIILTEEHCDKLVLFQKLLQHLLVHFFDLVLDFEDVLRCEPVKHPVGLREVAVVDHGRLLPEVHEGGQRVQAVFGGGLRTANLHKVDAEEVRLAVDFFEVLEDLLALGTVFVV